jgi:hypothetical protein
MNFAPVENVAVLALLYRTLYRNCYEGPEALHDDMRGNPDGISLLGMIGSQGLGEVDWELVNSMSRHEDELPVKVVQFLRFWSPLRCEALLHAWADDPGAELAREEWAQPFIERWELVSAAMNGLEPLTWDHEQQDDIARPYEELIANGYNAYVQR